MLQHPCLVMWDEDGMQSGGEGWVDVRFWAVADHPRTRGVECIFLNDLPIGRWIFFGDHFTGRKMMLDAATFDLGSLLGVNAFSHDDEMMAGAEIFQGFRHAPDQFDRMFSDGMGESTYRFMQVGCDGAIREPFKTRDKGLGEALQAVSMGENGLVFDCIQKQPDFLAGMGLMVEQGDEFRDGAFEVNVVLTERIIEVDEQRLLAVLGDRGGDILR